MVPDTGIESQRWSAEGFARFWSDPNRDLSIVPAVLTPDIVGHWSGLNEPVRGKIDYMHCIHSLVAALPGMRLTTAEHASVGEFVFIRWVMHAIGEHGPFAIDGIDRVRTRHGLVSENYVVFDTAAFVARSGRPVPWA